MEMIAEANSADSGDRRLAAAAAAAVSHTRAAPHGAAATAAALALCRKFLTFRLGEEEYGIDILRVQEIRSYEQPTRIANAPAFIKGVVNLRGVIVPIIDLRLKLGCATADYNAFTVVVVLNVKGRVVGAVVDSVSDVLELTREQIKPAPALQSGINGNCITGIGAVKHGAGSNGTSSNDIDSGHGHGHSHDKRGERMLILMDIEGLMSSADMGLITG